MISKELLSEILQLNNINKIYTLTENEITISVYSTPIQGVKEIDINIYELAYKCKEWAKDNGYYLQSGLLDEKMHKGNNGFVYIKEASTNYWFEAASEPEAVFKACEWIYQQQKESLNESKII